MTWAVMTREATAEPEATTAEKAAEVTAETGATASEIAAAIEATAVGRKTAEAEAGRRLQGRDGEDSDDGGSGGGGGEGCEGGGGTGGDDEAGWTVWNQPRSACSESQARR